MQPATSNLGYVALVLEAKFILSFKKFNLFQYFSLQNFYLLSVFFLWTVAHIKVQAKSHLG